MIDVDAGKTYYGRNEGNDATGPHVVTVGCPDGLQPLTHRVRHSPSGLSWGYGGSGPADLARSILWDHLDGEPHPACYQAFKWAHVARWPEDGGWSITSQQITRWLDAYLGPQLLDDETAWIR